MTESIFAGRKSLDELLSLQPAPRSQPLLVEVTHNIPGTAIAVSNAQYEPLPEPELSSAAQRVRDAARKLGIDYDAEIARTLNRMKNPQAAAVPGPRDNRAGADPVKDASYLDLLRAETIVAEQFRRFHGIT